MPPVHDNQTALNQQFMNKFYHENAPQPSNYNPDTDFLPSLKDFDLNGNQSANQWAEFNLTESDINLLLSSGIPVELQSSYGIKRVTDDEGALIVGQQRKAGREFSGIVFPIFSSANQSKPTEYELRRDVPDIVLENGYKKETGKYLRPPGRGNLLALPRDISSELLNDVSIPVLLCEGIKKMLAAWHLAGWNLNPGEKPRFIPVSIPGVNNWRGKVGKITDSCGQRREIKGLLTGFLNISLKHRPVIILFDNDVHTNFKVKLARHNCAETLQSETGAVCYFVDLAKDEKKIGFDDFLGSLGGNLSEALALLETKYRFSNELQSVLLDGKITLSAAGGERGKSKLTAKDINGNLIALDAFNLAEADKRNRFIKQIENVMSLSDEERTLVQRELLGLAEIAGALTDPTAPETVTNEKFILSEVLPDGRIIEALSNNKFAVYDSSTGLIEYVDSITANGTLYKPLNDDVTNDNLLVDYAEDYQNEVELIEDLESYIQTHYDLNERERKLSAYYILLTYVAEKFHEIPYLHPVGASGTGKSRFSETITSACYRPVFVVSVTEASLFRFVDEYKATLFIDEFNFNDADTAVLNQILNAGWSKSYSIPRTDKNTGKVEKFSPFGCKIIASYKKFNDDALESRCLEVKTKETTRDDIRFCNTGQITADALKLRRKLLMFRFRNLTRNFTNEVIQAEDILKSFKDDKGKFLIRPRLIQKSTPLFALIQDQHLRAEFINLLKDETKVTKTLNQESFDYEVVSAIHEILFDTLSENTVELREFYTPQLSAGAFAGTPSINKEYAVQTDEGEICEALTVENIVNLLNLSRSEKEKINVRTFGKTLIKKFGLETGRSWNRSSIARTKRAVIFKAEQLAPLFENHSLPIPDNFNGANGASDANLSKDSSLTLAPLNQNDSANNFNGARVKPNKIQYLSEVAPLAPLKTEKMTGTIKNEQKGEIFEI